MASPSPDLMKVRFTPFLNLVLLLGMLAGCQLSEPRMPQREQMYQAQKEAQDKAARALLESLSPEAVLRPDSLKKAPSPERVYVSRFQTDSIATDSISVALPDSAVRPDSSGLQEGQ